MDDGVRDHDEQLTMKRAQLLGMAFLDGRKIPNKQIYETLTLEEIRRQRIVPIDVSQYAILFGVTTTTSHKTMSDMQAKFQDQRLNFVIVSDNTFNEYLNIYDPPKKVDYQDIVITNTKDTDLIERVSKTLLEVRSDDILAYLVKQAYALKASDIHLECAKENVRVRFRVDGVLHPVAFLDKDKYRQLGSSIAVAANTTTNASESQTGHINREDTMADGTKVPINLRVETVPTIYGQDAVLRLFNFKPEFLQLKNLGMSPSEKEVIEDIIKHPTGLVLVVGPTGSGKTTTLYSMVNALNEPERKIITLEDPVEYYLDGVVQIPIDTRKNELGFSEKLRAVLRLDPDIIMIGEIRDLDTVKTALQASLTGHLVLSTYHASSAAAALSRMIDATGENPLLISAIRLVTAQRLVRVLDDATKIAYQPDDHLKELLKTKLANLPANIPKPDIDSLTLYKPGTSPQNPFGYNGQIAIRELMLMKPAVINVLKRPSSQINAIDLEEAAISEGMLTMLHDGILKAIEGKTSLEEVFRVIG